MTTDSLRSILRSVSTALLVPDLVVLILLVSIVIIMTGVLVAEIFTEHRHMKAELPKLLNALETRGEPLEDTIRESGLLKRQKKALLTICEQKELSPLKRESLAGELIADERSHYEMRTKVTDIVMKLGPMFGLMGTLIPLGPGIIALGQGDTYTLSTSLLTAFDTTVAGLIAAAVATLLSSIRKRWYARYMGHLESVMECLLEAMEDEEA